jgi:hypothetical protein
MRIGATNTWPSEVKRQRGYVEEIGRWHSYTEKPLVAAADMARAFRAEPQRHAERSGLWAGAESGGVDRDEAARAALSGEEWHNNMIRMVASYVARGLDDAEIHAITDRLTLPGYTVDQTRREVQQDIDGARRKGWHEGARREDPQPPPDPETVEALQFAPWQEIDLSRIPRVEFVYSDFYARGYTSVTIAPPKQGKSMLALAEAIDMATGRGILSGEPAEPRRVLYFNAEDDQNVLRSRVAALLTAVLIAKGEGWQALTATFAMVEG